VSFYFARSLVILIVFGPIWRKGDVDFFYVIVALFCRNGVIVKTNVEIVVCAYSGLDFVNNFCVER
jgi:hypothetical protein